MSNNNITPEKPTDKSVSLADYAYRKVGDDWQNAMVAALAAADVVEVGKGTYRMSTVVVPSGKTIRGKGSETEFVPLSSTLFAVDGSADAEIAVTADVADFSTIIPVNSDGKIKPDDVILLKSQRNCMFREDCGDWTLGQTVKNNKTCFFGELLTVASVSSDAVTVTTPTVFPYYRSNNSQESVKSGFVTRKTSTVAKLNVVRNVHLSNFKITGNAGCTEVVRLKYADECEVSDVHYCTDAVPASSLMVIKVTLSRNCRVIRCSSEYSASLIRTLRASLPYDYSCYASYNNFRILGSSYCSFEKCSDNFATHAFTITYSNGGIPSHHCSITGCHADQSIWAGVITQQCTPWSELSDNTVERSGQGVMVGSLHSKILNNTVSTQLPFSTSYYYTKLERGGTAGVGVFEGYGRNCEIRGNKISGFYTGIIIMDGYEQYNIFDRVDATISDNIVDGCACGFYLYRNSYNQTSRADMTVALDNNIFRGVGRSVSADHERATYGVLLDRKCKYITLADNTFDNYDCGVELGIFPNRVTLTGNTLSNCRCGFSVADVSAEAQSLDIYISDARNSFVGVDVERQGFGQSCIKSY